MVDPMTVGSLTASALAMVGETVIKGAVGEAVKDAYKALKVKLSRWAGSDVEALEKAPASAARQAVLAEVVDNQSADEQAVVRRLAEQLIAALKRTEVIGLDIGRLQALEVRLGAITVTGGTGARIDEVLVAGSFRTGDITVGEPPGKKV